MGSREHQYWCFCEISDTFSGTYINFSLIHFRPALVTMFFEGHFGRCDTIEKSKKHSTSNMVCDAGAVCVLKPHTLRLLLSSVFTEDQSLCWKVEINPGDNFTILQSHGLCVSLCTSLWSYALFLLFYIKIPSSMSRYMQDQTKNYGIWDFLDWLLCSLFTGGFLNHTSSVFKPSVSVSV